MFERWDDIKIKAIRTFNYRLVTSGLCEEI
jgi:hypothetical protein